MDTKHPHAALVDRLGRPKIKDHFNISRQAMDYWCKHGIPKMHHRTIALLGMIHGVATPELDIKGE